MDKFHAQSEKVYTPTLIITHRSMATGAPLGYGLLWTLLIENNGSCTSVVVLNSGLLLQSNTVYCSPGRSCWSDLEILSQPVPLIMKN